MKNIIHHIYACILTGLLFISGEAFAQNSITVKGTVKDSNGEPVIGSTVMVDGSNTGVVTDKEGKYSITFRPKAGKASKLVFSSISYVTQSVEVGNRTVIDIVLEEDSKQLDEVIVVGYGAMRKSDITGSVTSVKIDENRASQVSSIDQLLQGQAAGVQVEDTSLPVTVISDGQILAENLPKLGKNRAWVDDVLRDYACRAKDVYLLSCEPGGKLYFCRKERG